MTQWDAKKPIRIGILLSQTGALAKYECAHLQGTILGLEQINEEGGIDGRAVEPIFCDPASDIDRFRSLTHRLIADAEVSNIFGCCMSLNRKAVLPMVERSNILLWYPTQCEGFEYSPNIFYGGACPNQHVVPLGRYLVASGRKRVFLIGNDYVFPRETNRVMRDVIEASGGEIVGESYVPIPADRDAFAPVFQNPALRQCDAIFSTVVGTSNLSLFEAYRAAKLDRGITPIAAINISEYDVVQIGAELLCGHLVVLAYLESNKSAPNLAFVDRFKRRYGQHARANLLVASSYVQLRLFAEAINLCRSEAAEAVAEALVAVSLSGPLGAVRIDAESHYTYLKPIIAQVNPDGEFDIIHAADTPVRPDPFMIAYQ